MLTDETIKVIDNKYTGKDSRPFFIHLAYNNPHIPILTSPQFKGKSLRGRYGDSVEEMDDSVG